MAHPALVRRCTLVAVTWAASCGVPAPAHAESVSIPRVARAPRIADFTVAGASGSPAGDMARVEGLVQRTPLDGAPVSERTTVYLGYDDGHLYAVFVCAADEREIRAHRVNRDRLPDDDDSVALHLDTFRDGRRLYGFQVNPAGVQVDGVYTEGQGWDLSFDAAWRADTAVVPGRYVVLLAVPFSSLRFPQAREHRWGLFVYRGLPRKNEEAFWPAYSTRHQGRLAYAAEIEGIHDIRSGRRVRWLPYATFRSERVDGSEGTALDETRLGLDVKAPIRDNFVLDLTANPDFSQVESDEPQTTVNRRFETFFPERRPFFVENASYFDTPLQVLFTRRIREPRFGARLSGKAGRYAIGALVADDEVDDAGARTGSLTSVVRASRDLAADSHVGALYAGRAGGAGHDHAIGVDGRWRVNGQVVTAAQGVFSRSQPAGLPRATGTAYRARVDAMGRHYASSLVYTDVTPGFRAPMGFVPRTDIRELSQTTRIVFRPEGSRVTEWGPAVTLGRLWDHQGDALDTSAKVDLGLTLPRQTRASVFRTAAREIFPPERGDDPVATRPFVSGSTGVTFASAPLGGLTFSGEYARGTAVNLNPPPGTAMTVVPSRNAAVTVGARPTPAFTVDTTYLWTRLGGGQGAGRAFSDHLLRSRWSYQVSRRLSGRLIVTYHSLRADASRSSLPVRSETNVDVLLTYLVQPGTALYVGVNDDRHRTAATTRGRQLFVKLSCLLPL